MVARTNAKASKNQILAMIYANPRNAPRPRLNESVLETGKRPHADSRLGRRHTPDGSLIMSQLSIDGEIPVPLRPKSSQSFCTKVAPASATSAKGKAKGRLRILPRAHMISQAPTTTDPEIAAIELADLSRSMYQSGNTPSGGQRKFATRRPIRVRRPGSFTSGGAAREPDAAVHKVVFRGRVAAGNEKNGML